MISIKQKKNRDIALSILAIILYLCIQIPFITSPPGGFHQWRESDTAAVAEQFYRNGFHFFSPEVLLIGPHNTTVVGMELPIYNFLSALAYQAFGFSHLWPRLISILSAITFAAATGFISARLRKNSEGFDLVAAYLTLFCPLVLFYGGRIQPDLLGIAFLSLAAVFFFGSHSPLRLTLSALFLAFAGCIKPTFFFIGLPFTIYLLQKNNFLKLLKKPEYILFALCALVPAGLWLTYARQLSQNYGENYFYLGNDWTKALKDLNNPEFYQNVFLTWPFELVISLPLIFWFFLGLKRIRNHPGSGIIAAWLLGALIVFILAASHCATPHDYYYLPAVSGLILILTHGILSLHSERAKKLALTFLLITPAASFWRMQNRYKLDPEFWDIRKKMEEVMPKDGLMLAIDNTPSYQLYRTGRHGFQIRADQVLLADLASARNKGAYAIIFTQKDGSLSEAAKAHLEPLAILKNTLIYGLKSSLDQVAQDTRFIFETRDMPSYSTGQKTSISEKN